MNSKIENSPLNQIDPDEYSSESLYLLLETVEGINRTMELQSLLAESMEAARLVMNAKASSLMLLDKQTEELYVSLPTGPVKEKIRGKSIPRHKGVGGWVVEHKKPFLSNNPEEDSLFYGDLTEDFETKNIICVPLVGKNDEVIGVIQALNRQDEEPFTEKDVPVFEALASHVTIAIERTRKEEKVRSRLNQKEVLLTEIHHRVKNNLATISALIEIELGEVEDEHSKSVLKNTYSRIRSMIEVHDLLCDKGLLDDIELGLYLSKLSGKISETLSSSHRDVDILLNADAVHVAADKAMICGLVLNELLVNIYKHAFEGLTKGTIDISLTNESDHTICLRVCDNGIGVPEEFDLEKNSGSIGTWVINVLLRRLDATVEIESENGTCFSILFSK